MDGFIICPECGREFMVVWSNDGTGPPEYCPMCGTWVDIDELEDIDEH